MSELAKNNFKKNNIAKAGDIILFQRKEQNFFAEVIHVRENSVIVELSKKTDKDILGIETNRTVVAHLNYEITNKRRILKEPISELDTWVYGWKKIVN